MASFDLATEKIGFKIISQSYLKFLSRVNIYCGKDALVPQIMPRVKCIPWQINTCAMGKLISWQTSTCATNHATVKFFLANKNLYQKLCHRQNIYRDKKICATNYVTGKYLS